METWWTSMDLFLKIMWCIAIPTSVIFIIQMIMTFVGMDADGGMDAGGDMGDGDGTPFQLFTFRTFINFFLGFSWTGISLYNSIENKTIIVILAVFIGVILVAIVLAIFYFMSRMVQSGNIHIDCAVGLTATVYYPIAEKRSRAGKVQLSVHGAVREYDALTDGQALKTGEIVKIIQVVEGNMLLVQKL